MVPYQDQKTVNNMHKYNCHQCTNVIDVGQKKMMMGILE